MVGLLQVIAQEAQRCKKKECFGNKKLTFHRGLGAVKGGDPVITFKKLTADERADMSQKHGSPRLSLGRRKTMVPMWFITVRAVVPMGIAGELQSIGQIRSKVW